MQSAYLLSCPQVLLFYYYPVLL